jgi:hypothetical protein
MTDAPEPFDNHVYFSAEESSKGWAVYYAPKPERLEGGRTSYGLRIPIVVAHECVAKPNEVVGRISDILNAHWDDKP